VGNADKIKACCDVPQIYTVDAKSAKEVTLEIQHMKSSMILCIIADDHKLPPYVILSWRMISKSEMFPMDVTVHKQKWLDGS
jgi:hypothetical protein